MLVLHDFYASEEELTVEVECAEVRSVARYADEAGEKARRVCKRGRPYCSGSNFGALWRA